MATMDMDMDMADTSIHSVEATSSTEELVAVHGTVYIATGASHTFTTDDYAQVSKK